MKFVAPILCLVVGLTVWTARRVPSPLESPVVISGPTMGTTYSVTLSRMPTSANKDVVSQAIQEILNRVDREMSTYRTDSELSRFNQQRSLDWFAVSEETADR